MTRKCTVATTFSSKDVNTIRVKYWRIAVDHVKFPSNNILTMSTIVRRRETLHSNSTQSSWNLCQRRYVHNLSKFQTRRTSQMRKWYFPPYGSKHHETKSAFISIEFLTCKSIRSHVFKKYVLGVHTVSNDSLYFSPKQKLFEKNWCLEKFNYVPQSKIAERNIYKFIHTNNYVSKCKLIILLSICTVRSNI